MRTLTDGERDIIAEQERDARPDWRIGTPCPACNDTGDCNVCGTYETEEAYINAYAPIRFRLIPIPGVELGTCPWCHEPSHVKMCAPLMAELMKEAK